MAEVDSDDVPVSDLVDVRGCAAPLALDLDMLLETVRVAEKDADAVRVPIFDLDGDGAPSTYVSTSDGRLLVMGNCPWKKLMLLGLQDTRRSQASH